MGKYKGETINSWYTVVRGYLGCMQYAKILSFGTLTSNLALKMCNFDYETLPHLNSNNSLFWHVLTLLTHFMTFVNK